MREREEIKKRKRERGGCCPLLTARDPTVGLAVDPGGAGRPLAAPASRGWPGVAPANRGGGRR